MCHLWYMVGELWRSLAPDKDEEDKQQQQPQLGGGSSPMTASPMTAGAQSAPAKPTANPMQAPQRSAMQGGGSGFVNLQSYMSPAAVAQNQARVKDLGGKLETQEKTDYGKAAEPLRSASVNLTAPTEGAGQEHARCRDKAEHHKNADGTSHGSGVNYVDEENQNAPPKNPDADALNKLRNLMTASYDGPMSVDYDPSKSANLQKLSLLGNADTALNALNPGNYTENLPSAQYGQGNRWLDESVIKSDAGTMGEIAGAKSLGEKIGKDEGADMEALAAKATGLKDAAAKVRDTTRGYVDKYGKGLLADLQARADAANAQEKADYDRRVLRDPTTGQVVSQPAGQDMGGWEAGTGAVGTGATAANMATDSDRAALSLIRNSWGARTRSQPTPASMSAVGTRRRRRQTWSRQRASCKRRIRPVRSPSSQTVQAAQSPGQGRRRVQRHQRGNGRDDQGLQFSRARDALQAAAQPRLQSAAGRRNRTQRRPPSTSNPWARSR